MTAEAKSCRKKWKIAVSILLAVLILLAGGFFWYVSDYYQAEDVALEVLASGDHLEVRDDLTILSLSYPTDTAIIFYPGAKVEAAAYLPLLNQLRQTGLTCILVEMPFHLAIFDVNAAEDVMAQFPDIQHWYIAGHSMGGAMASQFASEYPDEVDGLLVLLNTVGGDIEAGLGIAELIASMSKPTVSLVLGGGHSIGVPLAVSAKRSFIAPSAAMTIHPVRLNGLVIGVPQTFYYFERIQERITQFVTANSRVKREDFTRLMLQTGELAADVGSVIYGEEAVQLGLIDEIGGLSAALDCLHRMIRERKESDAP